MIAQNIQRNSHVIPYCTAFKNAKLFYLKKEMFIL